MNQILNQPRADIPKDIELSENKTSKWKLKLKKIIIPVLVYMFLLSSCYIYASYNRMEKENQQASFNNMEETNVVMEEETQNIDNTIEASIPNIEVLEENVEEEKENMKPANIVNKGKAYEIAQLKIPKIDLELPVLSKYSEQLLNQSLNKYWGCNPNEVGNFCIVGHNYKQYFAKLPNLQKGDTLTLTDISGVTLKYRVYDKYIVSPTDTSCTSQLTNGKKEVTLITCTVGGKQRLIIKAIEI